MSAAKNQIPLINDAKIGDLAISNIQSRVESLDWQRIAASLNECGWARTEEVLTAQECEELRALYSNEDLFRSRVVMARHRFGLGEYKYFAYPLPGLVRELRESLYAKLAAVANDWESKLQGKSHYPATHREFIKLCSAAGQARPTPLMLRYESGGYNCLHQDLYGAAYFPLQTVFMLDRPELDFTGGEFVLVEQRPRAQSAAHVISPRQGEAVIFTTRWRPVRGSRGHYRVNIRHGVSTVTRGNRHTLGIVYHDAE
ncbi:MAG TPA: 2OG-Fe(II) oxygenase [Candidatus Angelobacter sp.]|nr:2OG-Fe(II) oxygenase [Candidatus Angelobacter sp.]